jgi:hypothetical protein
VYWQFAAIFRTQLLQTLSLGLTQAPILQEMVFFQLRKPLRLQRLEAGHCVFLLVTKLSTFDTFLRGVTFDRTATNLTSVYSNNQQTPSSLPPPSAVRAITMLIIAKRAVVTFLVHNR